MQYNDINSSRRGFLSKIATGAAALGAATLINPLKAAAEASGMSPKDYADADAWFNQINGKHRVVFDATRPHEIMPFAWPKVFLLTNAATGTPEKENSAVVVLRHDAIPYAFPSSLWAKYKFGEVFKADDPKTGKPSVRNPFWQPGPDDFQVPGLGSVPIGINQLQESGVLFCVCNMAIIVYSAAIAQGAGLNAEDVKKDMLANVLPGIQVVPSGVWALGRAQEHKCAYIFAG